MKIIIDQTPTFNIDQIERQLDLILSDSHFNEADILKRFLRYIVYETLGGRSNCLKEYTIATCVLDKSTSFKPQENGIVRIHAGRLRRALDRYYNGPGINDELIISIPKGKYIPEFNSRKELESNSYENEVSSTATMRSEGITIAVVPFLFNEGSSLMKLFMNGLCLQLTSKLMEMKDVSVISYQTIRGMTEKQTDLRALNNTIGCSHVISGCVQQVNDHIRLNVQLFLTGTGQMLWSEIYEKDMNKSNVFEVQDDIVKLAFDHLYPTLKSRKSEGLFLKLPAAV